MADDADSPSLTGESLYKSSEEQHTRDADGFPTSARRRLRKLSDGTLQDIDDGHKFKPRKKNGGVRLVPIFQKQVHWKTREGHRAIALMLDCAGASGQYTLVVDATMRMTMTEAAWVRACINNRFRPKILIGSMLLMPLGPLVML